MLFVNAGHDSTAWVRTPGPITTAHDRDVIILFCVAAPTCDNSQQTMTHATPLAPGPSGLYDPAFEHDACGLAFVADIAGRRSRTIVDKALEALRNLQHRGGAAEGGAGDGAGILVQMPDRFMRAAATACGVTLGGSGPLRERAGLPASRSRAPARDRVAIRRDRHGRRAGAGRLARCAGRTTSHSTPWRPVRVRSSGRCSSTLALPARRRPRTMRWPSSGGST